MIDPDADQEPEPPSIKTEPPIVSTEFATGGVSQSPNRNDEGLRHYAGQYLVEWMAAAVERAKPAIVAEAMEQNPNIVAIAELDKAIIDVISRWDFSQDPKQGSGDAR